tara:strand:+ start:4050 stop:4688 length:639 start_codon:yes stop_codon:yes gene_type:complete
MKSNKCLKNQVLPEEIGECDCCYDSDVKITVCPSNNKCEYALCDKCIKNLEKKTKSNKCPACREEIISIQDLNLEEPENLEIERNEQNWIINCTCCVCVLDYPRPTRVGDRSIVYCSFIQKICCCIYNQLKKQHGRKKAFILTTLIHIVSTFVGRIIYSEFYGETTPEEFWCLWYLFLGKAIIGFAIGICLTVASMLVIGCLYDCCCRDDDF